MNIAVETIKTCLPHLLATAEGQTRMKRMIPVYDEDLKLPTNAAVFERASRAADETLGLTSLARVSTTSLSPPDLGDSMARFSRLDVYQRLLDEGLVPIVVKAEPDNAAQARDGSQ